MNAIGHGREQQMLVGSSCAISAAARNEPEAIIVSVSTNTAIAAAATAHARSANEPGSQHDNSALPGTYFPKWPM